MKVVKVNNKYYVNDLDLEEVMANRKYIISYIDKQISYLQDSKLFNNDKTISIKLNILYDIKKKLKLRR